jgi:hypothetical protein
VDARILGARPRQHLLGDVRGHDGPARLHATGELDGEVARARGHVEHPVARAGGGEVGRAGAPARVHARRHEVVHPVVDPGDAVEHRTDLLLRERAGARAVHREPT